MQKKEQKDLKAKAQDTIFTSKIVISLSEEGCCGCSGYNIKIL